MESLTGWVNHYGLAIDEACHEHLTVFCHSLWQYNKRLNLTRHTTFEKFVARDLVDTLQLSKLLADSESVLDTGTGGGVPGLVLKIIRPDLDITCAESVGKKAAALNEVAQSARIDVQICNCRAESLLEDFRYDAVTARAVGPLWKICTWFNGHWISVGRLLAVKGPKWPAEKKDAEEKNLLGEVEIAVANEYQTPGTDWNSTILKLWAKGAPEPGITAESKSPNESGS